METSTLPTTEKKWFVYLGDHHEGPFTLDEVSGFFGQGQITRATYIWADGMPDWRLITEVSEFVPVLERFPRTGNTGKILLAPASGGTQSSLSLATQTGAQSAPVAAQVSQAQPTYTQPGANGTRSSISLVPEQAAQIAQAAMAPREFSQPKIISSVAHAQVQLQSAALPDPLPNLAATQASSSQRRSSRFVRWALGLLLVICGAAGWMSFQLGFWDATLEDPATQAWINRVREPLAPALLRVGEYVPAVRDWVSVIPKLTDITPEDYARLKDAAMRPMAEGASLEFAPTITDPATPTLVVVSNVVAATASGALSDVQLEVSGVPDTLLNHLRFTQRLTLKLAQRLGRSGPLQFADGKKLPRGEYDITARWMPPGASQPVITRRRVFLGGARDAYYQTRLKEFHEQLQARIKNETQEIRQFQRTIEGQLLSTTNEFRRLRRGTKPSAQAKRAWSQFQSKWTPLMQQLRMGFDRWTPEVLAQQYLMPPLYRELRELGGSVLKVHEVQSGYFSGQVDPRQIDPALASAWQDAQRRAQTLRKRVDQLERSPPLPSQIPAQAGGGTAG